jgi:V/A-type H+-transporting ATPase subunit A
MKRVIGHVDRVNGPVIETGGVTDAMMYELVMVGEQGLIGEVVKLEGDRAIVQVYEETSGVAPMDKMYGTGMPLSVELGPGLIGTIYDGVQRPLEEIRKRSSHFIERGIQMPALNRERRWGFSPLCSAGEEMGGGSVMGSVQETERTQQKILVPPGIEGKLEWIAEEGEYSVDEPIARMSTRKGSTDLYLMHRWPIRQARPVISRLPLETPLITGQRVIDTLFPVAKGGAVAIPGGFGTGKT